MKLQPLALTPAAMIARVSFKTHAEPPSCGCSLSLFMPVVASGLRGRVQCVDRVDIAQAAEGCRGAEFAGSGIDDRLATQEAVQKHDKDIGDQVLSSLQTVGPTLAL